MLLNRLELKIQDKQDSNVQPHAHLIHRKYQISITPLVSHVFAILTSLNLMDNKCHVCAFIQCNRMEIFVALLIL